MATGTRTSYTDANLVPESLNEVIGFIDWTEAPLLKYLGVNNESRFRFTQWPVRDYEWIEDEMSARSTTLGAQLTAGASSATLTDGSVVKEGDILKIGNELIYVSAVSSNTATITRGFAGTTDAQHESNDVVTLATIARLEGADFDTGHTTTVSRTTNYTQILAEAVKVTGSEKVAAKYGISDTMGYHIAKLIGGGQGFGTKGKAGKLSILLQQTFYHGKPAVGTATTARAMGGFEHFVTTNVTDLNSASLTQKHMEDLVEDVFLAGGSPDCWICNTWAWRKINSFFEGYIRSDRTESEGGHVIKRLSTIFGDFDIMFDRWCPADKLYLVEKDKMGWISYRPFDIYDRASTGDYEVKDILGEFGFVLMNEAAHGYIHDFSTSS